MCSWYALPQSPQSSRSDGSNYHSTLVTPQVPDHPQFRRIAHTQSGSDGTAPAEVRSPVHSSGGGSWGAMRLPSRTDDTTLFSAARSGDVRQTFVMSLVLRWGRNHIGMSTPAPVTALQCFKVTISTLCLCMAMADLLSKYSFRYSFCD